jgi:hypothetical protein
MMIAVAHVITFRSARFDIAWLAPGLAASPAAPRPLARRLGRAARRACAVMAL